MRTDSPNFGDRVAEIVGGGALACGAGIAVLLLSPGLALPPLLATVLAAFFGAVLGWAIVRAAPGGASGRGRITFAVEPFDDIVHDAAPGEEAMPELLLDDPLPMVVPVADASVAPERTSRVVQLFGTDDVATSSPATLQARIEAHLGRASLSLDDRATHPAMPTPDARDALHEALAGIRRTLRAG